MTIIVSSLSRMRQVAATRRPERVVSLLDPGTPFPHDHGVAEHLRLEVDDITEDREGWQAPGAQHVDQLIAFVEAWRRETGPILIHCYAGISRSTASAFITACVHNPQADETAIAWTLRRASSIAWPNRRIVALADASLGRRGRMLAAIDAIGPGHAWEQVGENEPFEFPGRHP